MTNINFVFIVLTVVVSFFSLIKIKNSDQATVKEEPQIVVRSRSVEKKAESPKAIEPAVVQGNQFNSALEINDMTIRQRKGNGPLVLYSAAENERIYGDPSSGLNDEAVADIENEQQNYDIYSGTAVNESKAASKYPSDTASPNQIRGNDDSSTSASAKSSFSRSNGFFYSNIKTPPAAVDPFFKPVPDSDVIDSPPVPGALTCSPNYGGGAYGNPISVTLGCTSASSISYCLSEGSCCDPASGATYSAPLIVGATEGTFCLSFYGESGNRTSNIVQVSYTVDLDFPHLQVTHPKVEYQTTQLAGSTILNSDDFSKSGYYAGQINMKSHNPAPESMNMNCQEIAEEYGSLSSPLASMILDLYDMMGVPANMEMVIPMNLSKMEYGENYITSFVVNQNESVPLYSCSTSKITLNDFDLFQVENAHWAVGGTGVQEFSGGFGSLGYYDETDPVLRAPASVTNDTELKSGLFDVVY